MRHSVSKRWATTHGESHAKRAASTSTRWRLHVQLPAYVGECVSCGRVLLYHQHEGTNRSANPMADLKSLGYFRFVIGFCDPIRALTESIEQACRKDPDWEVNKSLLVLPEAFNMGREYDPPPPLTCVLRRFLRGSITNWRCALGWHSWWASFAELTIRHIGSTQVAQWPFATRWGTT